MYWRQRLRIEVRDLTEFDIADAADGAIAVAMQKDPEFIMRLRDR